MGKEYSSYDEQIEKLKTRSLIISNEKDAIKILQKENYYNLINGYKDLFLDHKYIGTDEKYLPSTNFNEIYALYLFDRKLRSIFFKYILEIENNVKSVLAYDFSEKYGHDNYLKIDNFDTTTTGTSKKTPSEKIGDIADLIAVLQKEISSQLRKNNPMISHHILHHGYIPLWVLINKLSLGTVSIFYSHLKSRDKNDIGRVFSIKPDELDNFLRLLTIYRNACAHDERLYCLKALKKTGNPNCIKTNQLHEKLAIALDKSNNPVCGKNDLFAIVIIFKSMLDKNSFHNFIHETKEIIDILSCDIKVISIDNVLNKMGFPLNWNDIDNI